ncbi:glycosyltransferase [Sphingomonas sp. RB56-2]|uniref:Glycosyltransferase n=1 Tax=Sphingomonas brevis TaxID=2908206 RepID=A0ABT0S5X4_9SPHN|nr:glycosyltransferase [Sphingomonas brevis]MCL6739786.1 glycosyltransferase [Sphingomonas brevis]
MTPQDRTDQNLLIADLTQSWSDVGGGVRTYLRHKRRHILDNTPHRHLLIVPGPRDAVEVEEGGRAITAYVASPKVPGSPHYRFLLRNRAVRSVLADRLPDLIECQDAYNLPWAAIAHGRRYPETALVAAYCTDFPTVYVDRPFSKWLGTAIGAWASRVSYDYCGRLYGRFDAVYAMSENGGAAKLRSLGVPEVDVVPLGVELGQFSPAKRSSRIRHSLNIGDEQPLLIYVGRLDFEKRAHIVVEAFRRLPASLGAKLMLLGDGPLREQFVGLGDERIYAPGYCRDRDDLAAWLASADIYVSGMADETFGISVIEAQASGLPVVGVAAGAMVDRVPHGLGLVGRVDDAEVMAANIMSVLSGDRPAMAERAREHALQFSWDESMERLFGRVYHSALARAADRAGIAPLPQEAVLAEAA